ncbi:MAG: TMEM165/GDT1 family protein [Candidatus Saccharimonadales bacterium]
MSFSVIAIVFGVIFVSELPDKSMFALLILSTKYPRWYVWVGASSAFLVHVVIAVTAGRLLTLLPHKFVAAVVAGLFFLGAGIVLLGKQGLEPEPKTAKSKLIKTHSFWKVAGTAFGLIFIGEWGDITQIATANYAARYHDPLSVGVGAVLALWVAAGIAVTVGPKILNHLPVKLLTRATVIVLIIFGSLSFYKIFY